MAAIAFPKWYTLKGNVETILKAVAAEEKAVDPGREFLVSRDRWRPWIEAQQNVALVNILTDTVESQGGGSRRYKRDVVTVQVDLYALGTYEDQAGDLTPADEVAAKRLDLLAEQVRHALTRLANADMGFNAGEIDTGDLQLSLVMYSQEREETTGQYAPARWSFQVSLPYVPMDHQEIADLEELNVALEQFAVKYTYTP